jgi:GntR family transcriptional regulator
MPAIERPVPPSAQIANHYRDAILSGELSPGDRLPSINDLTDQWHVARATASAAMSRLQVEGAVYSTPKGTFVSSDDRITMTPGDRIRGPRPRRVGRGEKIALNEAGIVLAPNYVAELLSLEPGEMVIRREEITSAELLGPLGPNGPAAVIATVTGRHVTHAQDHLEGREADTREAGALRIPVGSPILAGAHVWSDLDGVILYGEWVMPPKRVVSYSYEVAE